MKRRMKAEAYETPLACSANEGVRMKTNELWTLTGVAVKATARLVQNDRFGRNDSVKRVR